MKRRLDLDKIAAGLGAERRGRVRAGGGYFGAVQLAAEVESRFRVPPGGGRATDPAWTERRLLPLARPTLERLEALARQIRERGNVQIEPMQLAALLLEKTAERLSAEAAEELVRSRGAVE